jgi:hypothetical protein
MIKIICAPIGILLGLAISIVPVKMILGKDYGEFRVVLLAKDGPPPPPASPSDKESSKSLQPATSSITSPAATGAAPAGVVADL